MITIVCTTNRPDSNTRRVCKIYQKTLGVLGQEAQILDLGTVNAKWIQDSHYGTNVPAFDAVVEKYVRSVDRLLFVVPEYNGGFPGYLKYFMDACDHHDWKGKRIAMMGLASGRAGNIRGLDHLTGILHYLGAEVYSRKVYISRVNQLLGEDGELTDETAKGEMLRQMEGFVNF